LTKCAALASTAETAPNGAAVVVARLDGVDAKSLQVAAEQLLASLGESAAVVLASELDGKVALVAALSASVVKGGLKAGGIVGAAAKLCGGGGGGKPNLAQVRFCRYRFCATGELKYTGAVG
jgi:alanyl-tRNA synthetase